MAMIETAPRAPFGAFTIHRIVATVEKAIAWVRENLAATRTADELARLSPRMRADIGIVEGDIIALRRKSFLL